MIFVRFTNLEISSPNYADPSSPILFLLWKLLKIMMGKTKIILFSDKKYDYNFFKKINFYKLTLNQMWYSWDLLT